ncbi:glycerophosphodiester phosphodiesterase family protein [Altererythrobacter sp. MF3-039]|uniref:glycerophosphodiester phosphodiesterase family protein n=1 Tax=Altererythrobacter sp. MF3-039 TaxID=3252901 RepID=UPI00390C9B5C
MTGRVSRMAANIRLNSAILAFLLAFPAAAQDIIAHRGASGDRPEHTLAAYELAIDQGADWIEPDLVVTKDLVLIARHENELSSTTDVASREEFEDRERSKEIDGRLVSGWFAEDFTLEELRTLRAKERLPILRPANARYNGLYQVPTFAEIVKLVRAKEAESGRTIGLIPELKHSHFLLQEAGIDMVDVVLKELREQGIEESDRFAIQSFEVGALRRLDQRSDYRLVQLVGTTGGPVDEPTMRYADMIAPSGLEEIAIYADTIAADIRLVLDDDGAATPLAAHARDAGLAVHAWTLRKENAFLPPALRSAGGEAATGNPAGLWSMLASAGVSAIFTDDPGLARAARDAGE